MYGKFVLSYALDLLLPVQACYRVGKLPPSSRSAVIPLNESVTLGIQGDNEIVSNATLQREYNRTVRKGDKKAIIKYSSTGVLLCTFVVNVDNVTAGI